MAGIGSWMQWFLVFCGKTRKVSANHDAQGWMNLIFSRLRVTATR
jgi:hypothetical protein